MRHTTSFLSAAVPALALAAAGPLTAPAEPAPAAAAPAGSSYVFAFFRDNGQDGLFLAASDDGYAWRPLNGDKPVLRPAAVKDNNLIRDPSVILGPDGVFRAVWTTAWTGKTIGYASSADLLRWSEPQVIPIMADEPRCQLCWAPEIRYDESRANYLVYWSSSMSGETPQYWRTYAATTTDFKAFDKPRLFFDPGHSQIDASLLRVGDRHLLFYKHSWKGIRYAVSDRMEGPYRDVKPLFTNDDWEGPFPFRLGDDVLVYADRFKSRDRQREAMGIWRSRDLATWEDATPRASFPRNTQHGSAMQVPKTVVDALEKR
jgi:hypothetical protein